MRGIKVQLVIITNCPFFFLYRIIPRKIRSGQRLCFDILWTKVTDWQWHWMGECRTKVRSLPSVVCCCDGRSMGLWRSCLPSELFIGGVGWLEQSRVESRANADREGSVNWNGATSLVLTSDTTRRDIQQQFHSSRYCRRSASQVNWIKLKGSSVVLEGKRIQSTNHTAHLDNNRNWGG